MMIRKATLEDHKAILAIAKQHRCTKDFGSHMFSPPSAYEKGWITVADTECAGLAGFCCVRHKVRQPVTVIYFIGVDEQCRKQGLATLLLEDLMKASPHRTIHLNCDKKNETARAFYDRHGFVELSADAIKGTAWLLEKRW